MRPDELDPTDVVGAIAAAAARVSNWGRWGADDVQGTLNFIDDAKIRQAAACVRTGRVISMSQPYDLNGPQSGWNKRTNPTHSMLYTGFEAEAGLQPFPHGFGGSDDVISMPLQCSTQWDGLGHIFDHGMAWNGRRASEVVTSYGDQVTGIQNQRDGIVSRGVLLDMGRHFGDEHGELPDGFAITVEHIDAAIEIQGPTSTVGRGDIIVVRTGHYSRTRRDGWGEYAAGPAPGMSFTTVDWLHSTEVAAVATDTWGFEVRPNEFDDAFQPLHQVVIPHMGMFIGEMWDPDRLAEACAADGNYDFLLSAAPLPFTKAVGSPLNPLAMR